MVGWLGESAGTPARVYRVGENTTRLLMMAGDLVVAWLLLREAEVALAALARDAVSASDRAFYEGKVAAARWFVRTALPGVAAGRALVESTDDSLMQLDESAL